MLPLFATVTPPPAVLLVTATLPPALMVPALVNVPTFIAMLLTALTVWLEPRVKPLDVTVKLPGADRFPVRLTVPTVPPAAPDSWTSLLWRVPALAMFKELSEAFVLISRVPPAANVPWLLTEPE